MKSIGLLYPGYQLRHRHAEPVCNPKVLVGAETVAAPPAPDKEVGQRVNWRICEAATSSAESSSSVRARPNTEH
jgi:hypothetical protein